jgi:hypothetical protein
MKLEHLTLVACALVVGCAEYQEVRFDADEDPPVLRFRREGQFAWDEVTVRHGEGVSPARFSPVSPGATDPGFLGWTGGDPASGLSVALDSTLVLTTSVRPLFLGDGETVLLLPDGLALKLRHPEVPVTHERYTGPLPDGTVLDLDVWFALEPGDATLSAKLDGVPAIALPGEGVASSNASWGGGRPKLLTTSTPGLSVSVTLDTTPPTAVLVRGEGPATQVTLERAP